MIEAVTAVARTDAAALAVVAGAARTFDGRQKRLRWLGALRAANGEAPVLDEEARDEEVLEGNRRRIRAALDTIEELRGLSDGSDDGDAPGTHVSAADLARLILGAREASIGAQAHLGAIAIRQLLG